MASASLSDRLRGILLNLYTNAAKFTRRGAICLKVSVHGPDYRPEPVENDALHEAVQDLRQVKPTSDLNLQYQYSHEPVATKHEGECMNSPRSFLSIQVCIFVSNSVDMSPPLTC